MKNNQSSPILSHSYESSACITPALFLKYKKATKKIPKNGLPFPKFCIITSQSNIVNNFRTKFNAKLFSSWNSSRSKLYVFKIKKKSVGIINVGIGAPQAISLMEMLIAHGAKNFIIVGSLGGISKELKIGSYVLATKAIRDEGTSYHYLRPGKYISSSSKFSLFLEQFLIEQKVQFKQGTIWTTDAIFRETKRDILKYQKQGVLGVDMKTSAIFSIAKYRKVNVSAFFYISDLLADLTWEPYLYSKKVSKAKKDISQIIHLFLSKTL